MNKKKKWIALLLVFVLFVTSFNVTNFNTMTASATETVTKTIELPVSGKSNNITWSIDETGLLTIEGTGNYILNNNRPSWSNYADYITKAVVNVKDITRTWFMFAYCNKLTEVNLSGLDTSKVINMSYMFLDCESLTTLDLSSFNTSKVTNMESMFGCCESLTTLDLSGFDTSKVTNMNYLFESCESLTTLDLSSFNTSNVTKMDAMFWDCNSLTTLDLSNFNTINVTDMGGMFTLCSSLSTLDVSSFDTSNVTDMEAMFSDCSSLTVLDVSGFNTSKVTNMGYIFSACSLNSIDVSNFDTSNVTRMDGMFSGCSSLTSIDISNFDTSNVTTMRYMFSNCSSLTTLDVSGFNISKVTDIEAMFSYCGNLSTLDVSNFDTSNVSNMMYMFDNCNNLKNLNISNFSFKNLTDTKELKNMLRYCNSLTTFVAPPNLPVPIFLPGENWKNEYNYTCNIAEANLAIYMLYTKESSNTDDNDDISNILLYGIENTYKFSNLTEEIDISIYKKFFGPAQAQLVKEDDDGTDGQCYGMANSVAASTVYDSPKASTYSYLNILKATTLNNIDSNWKSSTTGITAAKYIKYAHVIQYRDCIAIEKEGNTDRLSSLYQAVVDYLSGGEPVIIGVCGSGGGHALLALGIGKNDDIETEILVYDCNYPNTYRILKLFKTNGSYVAWEYPFDENTMLGTGYPNNLISYVQATKYFINSYSQDVNYKTSDYLFMISATSLNSTIQTKDGDVINLSPDTNVDIDVLLPISPLKMKSGNNSSNLYYANLGNEISFISEDESASYSIATSNSGVDITIPANSQVNVAVYEDADNSVDLLLSNGDAFELSYYDTNEETDTLDTITIKGIGTNNVETKQIGDRVSVQGSEALTIETENSVVSVSDENMNAETEYFISSTDDNTIKVTYLENNQEKDVDLIIENKTDISNAVVTLDKNIYTYDGNAKTPTVAVKLEDNELKLGTDYTVSYYNNVHAGSALVEITGINQYVGSVQVKFTIQKASQTIMLEKEQYSLKVGDIVNVSASAIGILSYKSNNENIVQIDNNTGILSALSEGETTITILASETEDYYADNKEVPIKVILNIPEIDNTPENDKKPEIDNTPENNKKPEIDNIPENNNKPEIDNTPENDNTGGSGGGYYPSWNYPDTNKDTETEDKMDTNKPEEEEKEPMEDTTDKKEEDNTEKEDGTDETKEETRKPIQFDTSFETFRLKSTKSTKTTNKLVWGKVKDADGYVVYGAPCNTKNKTYKMKKQVVIKDNKTTSFTDKNLKSGTYYKYYVKAYKLMDGKKVFLGQSKTIRLATTGNTYGNPKAVKVNDTNVTLNTGKKFTITAEEVKQDNKKIKQYSAIKFETSNAKVATVTKKGVIKAKKAGTATIYVYAQNGKYTKVKVTVK